MRRLIPALWRLTVLLLLAGCQPAVPDAAPLETVETLLVQVTPSARPVIPAVQACAALFLDMDVQIQERFAGEAELGLLIRLGEPEEQGTTLAQIASEEIGVILHPDNPAASLTVDQIKDLLTGKSTSWADLGGSDEAVKVWGLYPGDEARQAIERQILNGVPLASSASLAPDPQALQDAVLSDPAAIGFIPAAWAKDEVHFILTGVRLPVLAASDQPLGGAAAELTACLQGETGQTILDAVYP